MPPVTTKTHAREQCLDGPAETPASATLQRQALRAFATNLKPKAAPFVTIETGADAWTLKAANASAIVPVIDGTYPAFSQLLPTGKEPTVFCLNAKYLADVLASHGDSMIRFTRANDTANAPVFLTADDGQTRHIVMPMVLADAPAWKSRDDAPAKPDLAAGCPDCGSANYVNRVCSDCHGQDVPEHYDPRPSHDDEPAPVTPDESAFRSIREADVRRNAKRAARRDALAAQEPAILTCPECGSAIAEADRFCESCGQSLISAAPASVPVATPAALSTYSVANQKRILEQCPHATDVCGFRAWMEAGRVVRKGQKVIRIVAPVMQASEDGPRVVNIRPAYVFDVTQTDELPAREQAA